ncbi:DoxX family membrane protein [Flavobacterium supellecticarium]|uniref:DoxX family membrane protein n=1 Tax=Flavobacterium supellecticarium TaxID=2565924 RepID=A0A4S3ZQ72_9FLAO|nr:DoxX family membrane protein [Flavobacterium supellecticarium]THF47681.1 DoxX family membrane protein [Flavobacterium supellecticarium]
MTNTEIFGILILAFLAITFLQSGYDKIMDWKGNVEWLKGHFAKTFIKNQVPQSLFLILVLEVIAGTLCVIGIAQLVMNGVTTFGHYGATFSCVTLLFLLFGQRIAKDYDGARTIVIYFIPAILAVYWL